jgi:lipopolysaccharide transport system permease protein
MPTATADARIPAVTPVTVIEPSHGRISLNLGELWRYRELVWFLLWRDVKVRYKQTVLGVQWAVIQPLGTMAIFAIFFGRLAGMPSDGAPYALFALVALVPWTFFSQALTLASNSLVVNQELIRKVYFPRLTMPIAATLSCVVDFLIALVVLFAMMALYGVPPTVRVVWIPLLSLLAGITALGAGLWLAAANVHYRDVHYVVTFLVQLWLFASPVAYPSSLLSEPWRMIYGLNPMAGVIEGLRWALLRTGAAPDAMVAVSAVAALALLTSGAFYFRQMEKTFADVI